MPCVNGSARSLEVALGFVKPTDEHGLFASKVKHDRNGSVARCLNDRRAHFGGMLVEIVLGKGEALSFQEVLQGSAVPAKVPCVDEKIGVRPFCMLENQRFSHMIFPPAVVFNSLVVPRPAAFVLTLASEVQLIGQSWKWHGPNGVHGLRRRSF